MATNQARTNLGPLTTAVTLPSTCSMPAEQCSTCDQAWGGQTCFASTSTSIVDYGVQDNTDCWPSTTSFVATPPIPLQGWGFYSPGISCPSGMVSACSATGGGQTGWPVQFGLLSSETAVGCCPTGYTCTNNGIAQTCKSIASQTTFEVVSCVSGVIGISSYVTLPQTLTSSISSTLSVFTQSQYFLYAPLIQINWQASDRSTSTTSTGSSSTSSPTSSTPTQTASTTPTPTNTPSSSGLSAGAAAGIGIGAAIVVLAFIALGFFIFKKRKYDYKPAELGSSSNILYEMNAKKDPYPPYTPYATTELPSEREASELPPTNHHPTGQVYEM